MNISSQARYAWIASLQSGSKVILQSTFHHPIIETIQAISKVGVFAGNAYYRIDGTQLVSKDGYTQAWLVPATEDLVSQILEGNRTWSKLEWDAFQEEKLNAIPGNYKPELRPMVAWPVLGIGDRLNCFDERQLKDPLYLKEPRRIVFGDLENGADLFDPAVCAEHIARIFVIMALCPQHEFIVQTRNPERVRQYNDDWLMDSEEESGLCSISPNDGIGNAASDMIWSDWIEEECKPFRKALEALVYLAADLDPDSEDGAQSDHALLPLPNATFKTVEKVEAANG